MNSSIARFCFTALILACGWESNTAKAQTFSLAAAINNSGYIVGAAGQSPDPTAATAFVFDFNGDGYTNLGTLGGRGSGAGAINGEGQIVGNADIGVFDPNNGTDFSHAFLSDDEGLHDLGTLPGDQYSAANGINNRGDIVGVSTNADPAAPEHAFLYHDGVMTNIGTLGGDSAFANAINNRGDIVGRSRNAKGRMHAFLYRHGVFTDLGTLGGKSSNALAINNRGQIVGVSRTANNQRHIFLYDKGGMIDLNIPVAFFVEPFLAINDRGQIAGEFVNTAGEQHAFLYSRGVVTDLGTLGGPRSSALGINNRGQIVGESETADGQRHAFISYKGVMTDLDPFLK
ncbi:MAG: HAF repeat-containing protein [Acidobacteriota bacterium]|nr:HAF repeat-containing protein [Acidobacteriota bacterium]